MTVFGGSGSRRLKFVARKNCPTIIVEVFGKEYRQNANDLWPLMPIPSKCQHDFYVVMAHVVMAYVAMAYVVMAYVVMTYVVMTYVVMAYTKQDHVHSKY